MRYPESMSADAMKPATLLLQRAAGGDVQAVADLLPLVYGQLRAIAQERMAQERAGHTLQATALVHEAYLRLVGGGGTHWAGMGHFYSAAAEAMRRILIEHARARGRMKRGGDADGAPARRLPLSVVDLAAELNSDAIVSLDEAVRRMEMQDSELSWVVRLRFYAGLDVETTAAALGLSPATVKRRWAFARALLFRELSGDLDAQAGGGDH